MSTKRLAKELGLLRQRSRTSNGLKKSLLSKQIFAYLIVIDFESTCWKEKNNHGQEIIEFPAVLLNTSTGEIESEFHTYVQPQERPVLSEFCTELTGITQMQVEAGIPLQMCLSRFSRWLQNLRLSLSLVFPTGLQEPPGPPASQKPCAFLTWSDWDLGVCLQYECKRKQLHKPDVLNSWIDLRSTYRLFYDRKPKGLNGALQDLGIQFAGREHSGLDDARNTAELAARMMRDGCVMKITRSLARTRLTIRPTSGNTTAPSRKEKSNTDKQEVVRNTNKPAAKSCSELTRRDFESVPNCHSIVSPKTLLNGLSVTNISSLVTRDCPSPLNNKSSSLVLCSTTVGCLTNNLQLNQLLVTGPEEEEEEGEEHFSAETEDRCGSYDDVVLEGGDDVIGCRAWDRTESLRDNVSDCRFSVPRAVARKSNQLKAGLKSGLKPDVFRKSSKTNAPFPERKSSLISSFFRPRPASARHNGSSFSIYADPEQPPRPAARCSTNVLSSLSTNALSSASVSTAGRRVTSPLCACGRRAKRQVVSNGGPNHGRGFYCCPVHRSGGGAGAGGGRVQKGCEFFKWESALMSSVSAPSPAAGSSVSLCQMGSSLSRLPPQRSHARKSC